MSADKLRRAQTITRWILIVFYGLAGIGHFVVIDAILKIVPDFVPYPRAVVFVTGACEIVGAMALMTNSLRRAAGIAFALYAVCVFPANIKHTVMALDVPGLPSSLWYHVPRLLAQPVIVWAALFCVDIVRWPLVSRDDAAR